MSAERLPLLKAAYVVARRDFVAILFSRAFFFFLLGPLFPIAVGALAGGVGQRVESAASNPEIGVAMRAADVDAMLAARERLADQLGPFREWSSCDASVPRRTSTRGPCSNAAKAISPRS